MKKVDLIVPCYNESGSLLLFFSHTSEVVAGIPGYDFRFIFVDDGSTDNTLELIRGIAAEHDNVHYISFSRNFKKEAAMYAGLKASTGDLAAVIDADLQHPPELLADMLKAIEEGYDSCSARRVSREGEPKIRSIWARMFYKIINRMSEVEIVDGAVDYRMMTRQMVQAIVSLPEVQRFSKGIFCWVGFNTKWIEFKNVERIAGESKWSFWSLVRYAIDGITAFTTFPLRLATIAGACISFAAFIYLIVIICTTLIFGKDTPGYASTIVLLLFIGGVIILSLGIIGEYLARMYMETKRRPIFIARETNFEKEPKEK